MTNHEIEQRLTELIREERRITNEILEIISLAEARKIYLERGYPSLFEWLTKSFGYSNAAAYRRIQAARAIRKAPVISEKLADGSLNLTSVAKAESMIRSHERTTGQKLTAEEHNDVFFQIENRGSEQVDKTLSTMFPENSKQETHRQISAEETRLYITLSAEAMADLEWLKSHYSHVFPDGLYAKVIARVLHNERERCAKKPKSTNESDHEITGARAKKMAIERAQGKCQYMDEETGQTCGANYQLEVDHIIPLAMGGPDNLANMRCLCRNHNLFMAEKVLGKSWANHWRQ